MAPRHTPSSPILVPSWWGCGPSGHGWTWDPTRASVCGVANTPTREHPPHQLATVDEVAAYCRVTPKTVRRWIDEGRLTRYTAGARLIRIDLDEVDAMLRGDD